jgi:hypothetical protein
MRKKKGYTYLFFFGIVIIFFRKTKELIYMSNEIAFMLNRLFIYITNELQQSK